MATISEHAGAILITTMGNSRLAVGIDEAREIQMLLNMELAAYDKKNALAAEPAKPIESSHASDAAKSDTQPVMKAVR